MGKYHDTLGVSANANEDDIKKAYRRLAAELHPDKTGGDKAAEDRLKEVNAAYAALKKGQSDPEPEFQQQRHYADPFEAMRAAMAGMRGGFQSQTIIQTQVPLEVILRGGKHTVTTSVPTRQGNMMVFRTMQFEVDIEPDYSIDKRLRKDIDGSTLFIQVIPVVPDDRAISVQQNDHGNLDIHEEIEVDAFTAILGGEVELKHPNGQTLKVTIPENTDTQTSIRLSGKGMRLSTGRGDYLLHLGIKVPSLSPKQREILRKAVEKINSKNP